jgi:hypothetical protein
VDHSLTIKAIAAANGITTSSVSSAKYQFDTAVAPTISPSAGTYNTAQSVSISSTNSGPTYYYTTDGSTPTTFSTQYTGSFTVSKSQTVKAIATAPNMVNSLPATAAYVFDTVATPTFNVGPGAYTGEQSVTISSTTPGTTIYYTTDGTPPDTNSSPHGSSPILTLDTTTTLKAIAVATNMVNSLPASATYTIVPATPTFNPPDGTGSPSSTTITSTPGAAIYFTTDGSTPTVTPPELYSGPVPLTAGTTTVVQAIAVAAGSTSALGTATFVIP